MKRSKAGRSKPTRARESEGVFKLLVFTLCLKADVVKKAFRHNMLNYRNEMGNFGVKDLQQLYHWIFITRKVQNWLPCLKT